MRWCGTAALRCAAGFEALAGRCEAALVVSCDHPLLKPAFIARLIELVGGHPAVVPSHETRSYPLVAVYRLDLRPLLAELLARGERRVHVFAERCGAHVVSSADLADVDPAMDSLRNVNDRESYEQAMRDISA